MRYRANVADSASNPGFSFYELELFIDGDVTDYSSFYIEYNLMHSDKPDPENVWIDLHVPLRPAFAYGGMGLRIGNYQVPFGYENDDNEGYMYQGRASVNHSLIHGEKIDGWHMEVPTITGSTMTMQLRVRSASLILSWVDHTGCHQVLIRAVSTTRQIPKVLYIRVILRAMAATSCFLRLLFLLLRMRALEISHFWSLAKLLWESINQSMPGMNPVIKKC